MMLAIAAALAVDPEGTPPVTQLQVVGFEVCTEPRSWTPTLEIRTTSEGASMAITLVPDPTRQGFHTGQAAIPSRRWLDTELSVDGVPTWRRVVELQDPAAVQVSLLVEQSGVVTRVAWIPWAGGGVMAGNAVSLVLAFGWGGLCLAAVAWHVRRAR